MQLRHAYNGTCELKEVKGANLQGNPVLQLIDKAIMYLGQ